MVTGKKKNITDAGYSSAITYQLLSMISAAAIHIDMPPKKYNQVMIFFFQIIKEKEIFPAGHLVLIVQC